MSGSIEKKIRRSLLLSLTLVLSGLLMLMHQGIGRLTDNYVKTRLQHDAESIIAALQKTAENNWQLDNTRLATVFGQVDSGHYFIVLTPHETLSSRSLWDKRVIAEKQGTGIQKFGRQRYNATQEWLVWQEGIKLQNEDISLWIAEDITPLDRERLTFTMTSALLIVLAGIFLVFLQSFLVKREFLAFGKLQVAIRELKSGGSLPLPSSVPAEASLLVSEIRRLLEQQETRIRRSRNAIGNLAHELKRPLQRLHHQSSALPVSDKRAITETLDGMQHLIDRELRRARIAGAAAPGCEFSPAEDLPHLMTALRQIYPHIEISCNDLPKRLPQDRDDMLELLGNLLDNACKYAHRQVKMTLRAEPAGTCIEIIDDGEGIAEHQLDQLTKRGVRLDESRAGHGIGLSLCRDIVDSYNGSLRFTSASEGGLAVEVNLPGNAENEKSA